MLCIRTGMSALATAAVALAVCAAPAARAQQLKGAGATFPAPIYQKWFFEYNKTHRNVSFDYQPVGSGGGVAQYKAGTVDFGATDAPLSDAERASIPWPTLHIPTVVGAEVLAYNLPGIANGLKLSGDVIADIYLGKIQRWNDRRIAAQNPGVRLPALPITVVHRSDGSGTTYIFTNYLSSVSREWATRVGTGKSVNWPLGLGGNGNSGVAGLVRHSPGAIGYVELAYAITTRLTYGPVRNRAGRYVDATIASTTEAANSALSRMAKDVRVSIVDGPGANTYPIAGFTYLLVSRTPRDTAKARALIEFLRWAMGPGQKMAAGLLYAPLPPSVVKLNERAMSTIRL